MSETLSSPLVTFNLSKSAGYTMRKHKGKRELTYYTGFAKEPVVREDGRRLFLAGVFRRDKSHRGPGRRMPIAWELYPTRRQAIEAALLTHCSIERICVDGLEAGHIPKAEKTRLLDALKQKGSVSHPLSCPAPVLAATQKVSAARQESAKEAESWEETDSAANESDVSPDVQEAVVAQPAELSVPIGTPGAAVEAPGVLGCIVSRCREVIAKMSRWTGASRPHADYGA